MVKRNKPTITMPEERRSALLQMVSVGFRFDSLGSAVTDKTVTGPSNEGPHPSKRGINRDI